MSQLGWGFEGQTSGVAVSVANSATFGDPVWSAVSNSGTFLSYSNAWSMRGSMSVLVNVTTAATAVALDKADTASANAAASGYIYLTSYPTVDAQGPCGFRGSATALGRLNITSTGQLRHTINATAGTASTSTLSLTTAYRWETVATGFGTAASGLATNVYLGDSPTVLFTVPALTGQTTASQIDTVRWSKFGGSTTITYHLDECYQNIGGATTRLTPTSDVDLRWLTLNQAQSDLGLIWAVRSILTSDVDLRWAVRSVTLSDADFRWAVISSLSSVSSDVDLRWATRVILTSNVDLRWAVRAALASDLNLVWKVRSVALSDADVRWRVRAVLNADLSALWAVRGFSTSDLDARWRVLNALASDLDLRWASAGVTLVQSGWATEGSATGFMVVPGSPVPVAHVTTGTSTGPRATGG